MATDSGRPSDRDEALNTSCFCITLDSDDLLQAIHAEAADPGVAAALLASRPHLFAGAPVFLSAADLAVMIAVVEAIDSAAGEPDYQRAALSWAPAIADQDFGPRGVFMGYDFHLGDAGPKLIEINTNAGGAFLNVLLARAQRACCREAESAARLSELETFETAVWRMFVGEWRLQGREGEPKSIAIIDDAPEAQFLLPEFLLAQRLFERRGMKTWIIDPARLRREEGRLLCEGETVDLVYNRLVDFSLEAPEHQALREAYLDGSVVLTPNPRNHAVFADKRNLSLLSGPLPPGAWGLTDEQRRMLMVVPRTRLVDDENADQLWADRKHLFFKPAGGHGGKAVYRGDKMTRGVWSEVRKGGYIAQDLVTPSRRKISVDGVIQSLKLDIRLYTYRSVPLIVAARVYDGQTTNFRTPGGGFAPVYIV